MHTFFCKVWVDKKFASPIDCQIQQVLQIFMPMNWHYAITICKEFYCAPYSGIYKTDQGCQRVVHLYKNNLHMYEGGQSISRLGIKEPLL